MNTHSMSWYKIVLWRFPLNLSIYHHACAEEEEEALTLDFFASLTDVAMGWPFPSDDCGEFVLIICEDSFVNK